MAESNGRARGAGPDGAHPAVGHSGSPLWAPYEHPSGDFALGCPAEWEVISEADAGPLVVLAEPVPADGGFRTNLTVVAEPLGSGPDLDSVVEGHLGGLEEFLTDLHVLDVYELELDERPCRRVVCTFRQGKTTLAIDQWLVVADERLLVVTATASASRYSEADLADLLVEMIASLKVRSG